MRLLITADLHYNHPRSKALAIDLIDRINHTGCDILLLVGDTSTTANDSLEQCLSLFRLPAAKKLVVAGNHELWTASDDSYAIYTTDLPRRLRALDWHWLEADPFISNSFAIVGSLGWYDFSFAQESLGIPLRFYEQKISPGAAARFPQYAHLFSHTDDIPPSAMQIMARWNDGRFIKLHRSDEQFLSELLLCLHQQLQSLAHIPKIIAAIHHLPFRQLLPPPHSAQWDFAKAYLGSQRLGELLLQFPNITHLFCGHSHMPIEAKIQHIQAINIGSGYRHKVFRTLDITD
jgi:predicted phosphodiesterase